MNERIALLLTMQGAKQVQQQFSGVGRTGLRQIQRLRREWRSMGRTAVRGVQNAGRAVGRLSGRGGPLDNLGAKLAVTAAASAALWATFSGAATFETETTKLITQLGLTADEVADVREELTGLSGDVGVSANELARASFAIQSAGLRGKEASEVLESSAKLAALGLGDTRDIALATGAAMTAYGFDVLNAAKASDVLLATVKAGNLEASQLASSLGQALPVASALGVSFDELGAGIAVYTRLGLTASEATTGVRAAMTALLSPSIRAQRYLRELGLEANEVKGFVGEHGLVGALQHFRREIGDDTKFAKFLGSVEALNFAIATTDQNFEEYNRTLGEIQGSAGTVEEAFTIVQETTAQTFARLRADLGTTAIEIGTRFLPMVNTLLGVINDAVKWFSDLDDEVQYLIIGLGALVTGLLIGVPAFVALGSAAAAAWSAVGGPITLIVAALVAAGAAIYVFRDDIKNALIDAAKFILSWADEVFNAFAWLFEKLVDGYNSTLGKLFGKIDIDIEEMRENFARRIDEMIDTLEGWKSDSDRVFGGWGVSTGMVLDQVREHAQDAMDGAAAAVEAATDKAGKHIDDLRDKAAEALDNDPFSDLNASLGRVSQSAANAQSQVIAVGAAVQIAELLARGGGPEVFGFIEGIHRQAVGEIQALQNRVGGVQSFVNAILQEAGVQDVAGAGGGSGSSGGSGSRSGSSGSSASKDEENPNADEVARNEVLGLARSEGMDEEWTETLLGAWARDVERAKDETGLAASQYFAASGYRTEVRRTIAMWRSLQAALDARDSSSPEQEDVERSVFVGGRGSLTGLGRGRVAARERLGLDHAGLQEYERSQQRSGESLNDTLNRLYGYDYSDPGETHEFVDIVKQVGDMITEKRIVIEIDGEPVRAAARDAVANP